MPSGSKVTKVLLYEINSSCYPNLNIKFSFHVFDCQKQTLEATFYISILLNLKYCMSVCLFVRLSVAKEAEMEC